MGGTDNLVLQGQFILGLQTDTTDETHKCYKSWELMAESVANFEDFRTYQFDANDENGRTLAGAGVYAKIFKRYSELGILGYNVVE